MSQTRPNERAPARARRVGAAAAAAAATDGPQPHDPAEAVRLLLDKLGQPRRHLSVLIGAGASRVAGVPDLAQLGQAVAGDLEATDRALYNRLSVDRNLEALLSYLRLTEALLAGETTEFNGLTAASAAALDGAVTRSIAKVISTKDCASEAHERLAAWLGRSLRPSPVEVFTTNYDLLIERALEARGVPYFDGFVGIFRGGFRPDLIEPDEAPDVDRPPTGWVRIWKLHGSVSWEVDPHSHRIQRVNSAGPRDPGGVLAIYPSADKYEESRRMPFLALADRFRRALATPESTTVTIGYSFGDAHINELIFDAAERYQRSEVIALMFDGIPDPVTDRAQRYPNFNVYGRSEGVLAGERAPWAPGAAGPGWDGTAMTVGDFATLATLLARAEELPEAGASGA